MSGRVRTIAIVGLALAAVALVGVLVLGGGDDAESASGKKKAKPPSGPTSTTSTTTPTVPPPPAPVLEPVGSGPTTTVARGARRACGSGAGSRACRVTRTLRPAARPKPAPDIPLLESVSPTSFGDPDLKDAADPSVLVDGQTYFVFTTTASQLVPVHAILGSTVARETAPPGLRITAPAPAPTTLPTPPGPTTSTPTGTALLPAARPAGVPEGIPLDAGTVARAAGPVDAPTAAAARAQQPAPPPREAMPNPPVWAAERRIWAPTVAQVDDTRWIMFFAARRPNPPDPANAECIGRAVAAAPGGPYVPDPSPFTCGIGERLGALDPSFFRDSDGTLTLHVAFGGTTTNIWAIPLKPDATADGPAVPLLTRRGWEEWFLENPSMIPDGQGKYLLAYSAGKWQEPGYSTGLARCLTPRGPCRQDLKGPWLASAGGVTGTGGLSFFTGVGGSLFAALHGYRAGQEKEIGGRDTYLVGVDLRRESIRLG